MDFPDPQDGNVQDVHLTTESFVDSNYMNFL